MKEISVIIPVRYESNFSLSPCIAALAKCAAIESTQITVVGLGAAISLYKNERYATHISFLESESCSTRSDAMNFAAQHSKEPYLFFLHADCLPHPEALTEIKRAIQKEFLAGAYLKRYARPSLFLQIQQKFLNLTAHKLQQNLVGTNGLFIRRETFLKLGLFPKLPFMEDVFFFKTLKHHHPLYISPKKMVVSARNYQKFGGVFKILSNISIYLLALIGFSPKYLKRLYI